MKKAAILMLVVLLIGCSSSNDTENEIPNPNDEVEGVIYDEKITFPHVWTNQEKTLKVTISDVYGEYRKIDYEDYKNGLVEDYDMPYYSEYVFTIKIFGVVEISGPTKIETGEIVEGLDNIGVVSMFKMSNGFWAINSEISEDGSFYGIQTHYLDYKPKLDLSYFFLFDTTGWTPDY